MMKREGNIEIPQACQRATHLPDYIIPTRLVSTGWQAGLTTLVNTPVKTTPTGLTTLSGWTTPVFSSVSDFLFPENIQYRIRNQKSGNEGVPAMLQCDNATMPECRMDRVFALKGQVISAQGNALRWKGTRTPAPWFSAPNPAANKGYKFQQVRVNLLQGQVNPLQGRVATLHGSRYFQQVQVATLQGSPYFQQGTVSAVPDSLSDSLFLISYFLFSENVEYRIRNQKSGNEEMSYKLTTTYPSLQTRGRGTTTPTGLTTLSGWTTLSGCDKNEIQFSKYLASGETVIHRAQAVRACLLPFYFFLNNN